MAPSIEIRASEVARFSKRPWSELNIQERKHVASQALRARDPQDYRLQRIAWYIETNNPNFSDFVIVDDMSGISR